MKESRRGELGGAASTGPFRAQNRSWAPLVSYSESKARVRRGGADQAPMYKAQHHYIDALDRDLTIHGHLGSSLADESHLVDNEDIDWNRHMDRAGIPEHVRGQYGADIVQGVIHKRRMALRGLRQFDTGPRGDEGFNNSFTY